jgi:hypothetical protein
MMAALLDESAGTVCNNSNSSWTWQREVPSHVPSHINRFQREAVSAFFDVDCLRCQGDPMQGRLNITAYEQISAGLDYTFGPLRFEAMVATQIQIVANFLLAFLGGIPPPSYGCKGLFGIPWALWMLLQAAQIYLGYLNILIVIVSYFNMEAVYYSCMNQFHRDWSWISEGTACLNAMLFNGFFFHPLIVVKMITIGQSCFALHLGWKLAGRKTEGKECMFITSNAGRYAETWISMGGFLLLPIQAGCEAEDDDIQAGMGGFFQRPNPDTDRNTDDSKFSTWLFSFIRLLTTPIIIFSYYLFFWGILVTCFMITFTGFIFGYMAFIPLILLNILATFGICFAIEWALKKALTAVSYIAEQFAGCIPVSLQDMLGIRDARETNEEQLQTLRFMTTFRHVIAGFLFNFAGLAPYLIGAGAISSTFANEPTINDQGEEEYGGTAFSMFYQYTFQWFSGSTFAAPSLDFDVSDLSMPQVGTALEYVSDMFGKYTRDDFDHSLFVTAGRTIDRLVFAIALIKAGLTLLKTALETLETELGLFTNASTAEVYKYPNPWGMGKKNSAEEPAIHVGGSQIVVPDCSPRSVIHPKV